MALEVLFSSLLIVIHHTLQVIAYPKVLQDAVRYFMMEGFYG